MKDAVERLHKAPPLGAILGNLPSAASLDLQQDLESAAEPEGETTTSSITGGAPSGGSFPHGLVLFCCFPDEQVEGGELDLDGIDDREIDKVTGPS